jgi:hypothetical protein
MQKKDGGSRCNGSRVHKSPVFLLNSLFFFVFSPGVQRLRIPRPLGWGGASPAVDFLIITYLSSAYYHYFETQELCSLFPPFLDKGWGIPAFSFSRDTTKVETGYESDC